MGKCDGIRRVVEHLGRGQLRLVAVQICAGGFGHRGQDSLVTFSHQTHNLIPRARHGFAEIGVRFERFCVDDHQVDDLTWNVGAIKKLGRVRVFENGRHQWVPRDHRFDIIRLERRDHIRVGCVNDAVEVRFAQTDAIQRARQKVMRHRQFYQVHWLAHQIGKPSVPFEDDCVVAV